MIQVKGSFRGVDEDDVIDVDKASTDSTAQRAPFVRRGPQTYRILKVLWFFRTGLRFVTEVTILHSFCEIGSNFANNYKRAPLSRFLVGYIELLIQVFWHGTPYTLVTA